MRRNRTGSSRVRGAASLAAVLVAVVLAPRPSAGAAASGHLPAISISLLPLGPDPCAWADSARDCDQIATRGHSRAAQAAYIVVAGVTSITQVQFGIAYDDGVVVKSWAPCLDGVEIASPYWPASNSSLDIGWTHCMRSMGEDELTVIGWLEIEPYSWGRIWITDPGRDRDATITACLPSGTQMLVPHPILGSARTDGIAAGRDGCKGR